MANKFKTKRKPKTMWITATLMGAQAMPRSEKGILWDLKCDDGETLFAVSGRKLGGAPATRLNVNVESELIGRRWDLMVAPAPNNEQGASLLLGGIAPPGTRAKAAGR
jgi:hypothetical protein